ncbi:MAG TPA: hypothetical protein DCP11_08640, partial [Microbacteriaceae bacterium]|nr:hypothetical protein [Microbacteriaceae bacterium]
MSRKHQLDGLEHRRPEIEDHVVTESQRVEFLKRDLEIFSPIRLESIPVELVTVNFDRDTVFDHQVDLLEISYPN